MIAFSLDSYGVNNCEELLIVNDTTDSKLYFRDATNSYSMSSVPTSTTPTDFNTISTSSVAISGIYKSLSTT